MRILIPSDYAFSFAAILMFSIPFIMKREVRGLRWDAKGFLTGLIVSVAILVLYTSLVLVSTEHTINLSKINSSLIFVQLFFISIPEEAFFRGYLQENLGNNLMSVVVVSFLFALGHFFSICLLEGFQGLVCAQNFLTFFPSIIMGYLYLKTGTLWSSITFHFLSNVVYISTGGL
jgi:uncharacterized protein